MILHACKRVDFVNGVLKHFGPTRIPVEDSDGENNSHALSYDPECQFFSFHVDTFHGLDKCGNIIGCSLDA